MREDTCMCQTMEPFSPCKPRMHVETHACMHAPCSTSPHASHACMRHVRHATMRDQHGYAYFKACCSDATALHAIHSVDTASEVW